MSRAPLSLLGLAALVGGAALVPLVPAPAAAAPSDVVINEIVTNDPVLADSIELYNTGTEAVDPAGTEAADRGLWEEPDPEVVRAMQQVYLDIEGDMEDGE